MAASLPNYSPIYHLTRQYTDATCGASALNLTA
jgi:hypothetical protein